LGTVGGDGVAQSKDSSFRLRGHWHRLKSEFLLVGRRTTCRNSRIERVHQGGGGWKP
jgi:hypothetical protein